MMITNIFFERLEGDYEDEYGNFYACIKLYNIDFKELNKYINLKTNKGYFVLRNPVGEVYICDPDDPITKSRVGIRNDVVNSKPVAVIGKVFDGNVVTNKTQILWDSDASYSIVGNEIVNEEWVGKQDKYTQAGEYIIKLRVQDEKGVWSDWVKETINVIDIGDCEFRYLVFDINDHYVVTSDSTCATITEIELYDGHGQKISYIPDNCYDSVKDGLPQFWNSSVWCKNNLSNGNKYYVDNGTGQNSSFTIFFYTSLSIDKWGRLVLDMEDVKNLSKISLFVGSPEGRIPHYIKIYGCLNYDYDTNIKGRQNDNLVFIEKLDFEPSLLQVTEFVVNL